MSNSPSPQAGANPANPPDDEPKPPKNPFWPAPEVADLAEVLIAQKPYHVNLRRAIDEGAVTVVYLFSEKVQTIRGKQAAATCTLKKGVEPYLMAVAAHSARNEERVEFDSPDAPVLGDDSIEYTPFFLIRVWDDAWRVMEHHERMIVVDHELKHCGCMFDEDKQEWKFHVVPHDFEDFHDIAQEWGAWSPTLRELQKRIEIAEGNGMVSKPESIF